MKNGYLRGGKRPKGVLWMKRAKKSFFGGIFGLALVSLLAVSCATGGLSSFGAEIGEKRVGPKTIRIPYTSVVNYFGYAIPGVESDAMENGKKKFFIYVWVPVVAPEIGVRMISPIPAGMNPGEGDFVSSTFAQGEADDADRARYFDTWIAFERADGIFLADQIPNALSATWSRIEYNDDSSEMPNNPAGNRRNSLLRVVSDIDDPLRSLVAGLYRVAFTSFGSSEVEGSFLAQIGAPIAMPGVVIGQTIDEIVAALAAAEAGE
jgi:hypothetical protein